MSAAPRDTAPLAGSGELTHSQQQIWIGQQLHPASPLYNMAFAFVLPAGLDRGRFREAWQRVADRSDALRTRVVDVGRGPRWTLAPRARPTGTGAAATPGEFLRWCSTRAARPLPLDGDLVDSVLVELDGGASGWYLNQHHLVADAWSTVLLYREVAREYAAAAGGEPGGAGLPGYYATAAALAHGNGAPAAAAAHWAARRAGLGQPQQMYGRNARATGTASTRLTLPIDERRAHALGRRLSEPGFTTLMPGMARFALFATLLAAWLHRIGDRRQVAFDAPVTGRPTAAARRALGVFIEMFPFAVAVEAGDTFRDVARRCLDEAGRLLTHARPGTSAPSSASASPFVLNYVPVSFGSFAGLEPTAVEWIHPGHGDSVHVCRLQVHDFAGAGREVLHFDFNDAALDARLRRRSVRHFEALLDALLADPDGAIDGVDVRTDEERRAFAALNATDRAPLPTETVVAMFERRAAGEPDRVALRQGTSSLTFGALRRRVDAIAATLAAAGITTGDRVAIAGRRSISTVAAVLGALRAGAAFVPIDPFAPASRMDYALQDSGARALLVGDGVPRPPDHDGLVILDAHQATAAAGQATPPGPSLGDAAYMMYTSGSTGRPKAVPIEHGGLADYLLWAERRYVRGDRLVYALFTSLAFDLTITSLFLPLVTGGTMVILPEPDGPVDSAVMDVGSSGAGFVKLTPSHLAVLRSVGLAGSGISRMVVGGEDFKTALARTVSEDLGHRAEIYNEYGPTEAIVGCVAHRFDPELDTASSVPIGAPADHVRVAILNDAGTPVPEGVAGELWVSRYGMAPGYHNDPGLTARCFPPSGPEGGRWYRTGDLVRQVDPSALEYLGRIDRQVKIGGVRIEPGEVEATLLAVPGVEACVVVAQRRTASAAAGAVRHCVRCGLASNVPRAALDEHGVCAPCRGYDAVREHASAYFGSMEDLQALIARRAAARRGRHDVLMLYSGGKDSTYALCRLVALGVSVHAFTLDNGFLSDFARENIRRVASTLGISFELATTPAMHAIFRDSLARFSNVCNGCFKTIYTLGMLRARELGIPTVITGLSRGQLFETRLSEDVFRGGRFAAAEVDAAVLAARKAYHRAPDEVSRSLDVAPFAGDDFFEEVEVVDFYRYCDVSLDEMLAYLERAVPWTRPADTGRSTNCLINDLGIYVHRRERGFHNYALPYSWDVRLGHKTREAALAELDDEIEPARVRGLLAAIGYDESRIAAADDATSLVAFYVAHEDPGESRLRQELSERLPASLVPQRFERIAAIPLTVNGKVDEAALLRGAHDRAPQTPFVPPEGPVEEFLAALWAEELGIERAGRDDHFFELGGTSLSAMRMVVRLCQEFDIDVPLPAVFTRPRLRDLARMAEDRILGEGGA